MGPYTAGRKGGRGVTGTLKGMRVCIRAAMIQKKIINCGEHGVGALCKCCGDLWSRINCGECDVLGSPGTGCHGGGQMECVGVESMIPDGHEGLWESKCKLSGGV